MKTYYGYTLRLNFAVVGDYEIYITMYYNQENQTFIPHTMCCYDQKKESYRFEGQIKSDWNNIEPDVTVK